MKVRASPSTSVAAKVRATGVSSSVTIDCGCATGASFRGSTSMLMVARLDSAVESRAVNVNASGPK